MTKDPPVFALQHQRTVDFVDELMKILLIPTHAKGAASKPSPLTTAPQSATLSPCVAFSLRHKKGESSWGVWPHGDSLMEMGSSLLSRLRSTIGVPGLSFSVRDGKRRNPGAVAALDMDGICGQDGLPH